MFNYFDGFFQNFISRFALHMCCMKLINLGYLLYWGIFKFSWARSPYWLAPRWCSFVYGACFVSFSHPCPSFQGVGDSKLGPNINIPFDFLNSTQEDRKWIRVGKFASACSQRDLTYAMNLWKSSKSFHINMTPSVFV